MRYLFRPLAAWTDPETYPRRSSAVFRASWSATVDLLASELAHLDAAEPVVLQADVQESDIRLDGMLRAGAKPGHPGVVISFDSKLGPLRYATDAYDRQWPGAMPGWQANVRAIALTLGALRSVDRWGVTKRSEQYAGWKAIEAPRGMFADAAGAGTWMRGYAAEIRIPGAADAAWKNLYRAMARRMHPDTGNPRAEWDRLEEAKRWLEKEGWL